MESVAMGGYGGYVWGSFGLTFAVVVIAILQSRFRHQKLEREIRQQIAAREARS